MEDIYQYWMDFMLKIHGPVIEALAEERLKRDMPVEASDPAARAVFTHLEAFGRTICSIAPWLETGEPTPEQERYRDLCKRALDRAVDPGSPDFLNFSKGPQPIVDAAFLCQGLLRAPRQLMGTLDETTRRRLIACLRSTKRGKMPYRNNWLLFSAMIEAALFCLGDADWDAMRIDYALHAHESWYLGDGVYGDGPQYHCDYYNSFVIQPMLTDLLCAVGDQYPHWRELREKAIKREARYACLLERQISPEGYFPVTGRSITYRTGCFHALAHMIWIGRYPGSLAGARCALTAVMKRVFSAPSNFDENGWLTIGLCGAQPSLGEAYISTGSLYLCGTVFLPLGLPKTHPFWQLPDEPFTAQKIWAGENMPADHAIIEKD